jgi:hypothetical protein
MVITSLVCRHNPPPPPQRCTRMGGWPSSIRWPRASGMGVGALEEAVEAGAM